MKKILTLVIFLLTIFSLSSKVKAQPLSSLLSFTIDFRFNKMHQNKIDSLFYLEYIFESSDFQKFSKIYFEDSKKRNEIDLRSVKNNKVLETNEITINEEVDIIYRGNKIVLVFKQYDKKDLPVPVEIDDSQGKKKLLHHKYSNGYLQDSKSFRQEFKRNVESLQ